MEDDEAIFGEARQDVEQMMISLALDTDSVKLLRIFKG
jgi:hypothetical protein